ncbi:hypothetical protein BSK71_14845 [Pectobacterium actinidiae]|uniref:Uncharacterized protein n=2 Tax=Pectobacterium actinidiae TaxID=1507808 RepID=A0A1V2R1V3_9GAMM|nr:beta-propeller fold lactonase family protein [Pectobacterium actinidiae]KHN89606.1 hypothetical protein KKH3_41070 [Pectobacterium actinidiae]ONK02762.1 hypothetical protein BSK69_15725 [Pectobacterium actinidiae]ONK04268.1 hypothetical protein BSK71_14845 [Pectobacterium actinidiae]
MPITMTYGFLLALAFSITATYAFEKEKTSMENIISSLPISSESEENTPEFISKTSEIFLSNVFNVVTLSDQSYAFASISDAVIEGITSSPSAAIAVLKKRQGEWKVEHYLAINSADTALTKAFGMALSKDESVLSVAVREGVVLLDVSSMIQGQITSYYVDLNTGYTNRRDRPGSIAVVSGNDNRHFFIADEYGEFPGYYGLGDVAIVSYQREPDGRISAQRLGYIRPEQNAIAGLNISPDGKTLYIPSQVSPEYQYRDFAGLDHLEVAKQCGNSFSGSISIVDVETLLQKAETNPGNGNRVLNNVIQAKVAAGCGVVRIAVSNDSKTIWSTARTDNKIHAFDATRLRNDPNNAYLYSASSGGTAPVGISSFSEDRYLAVSNSNRFDGVDENGNPAIPNISIFDVSKREQPELLKKITSGEFPRDISRNPNDQSVFVANWRSFTFQEISIAPISE